MRHPIPLEHLVFTHRELRAQCGMGFGVLVLVTTVFVAFAVAQGRESDSLPKAEPAIDVVWAAWSIRTAAITSIAITCEIDTTVIGDGGDGKPRERFNPFAEAIPSKDKVLKATAEYAFENGKITIKKSGDVIDPDDPEAITRQILNAAFDGQANTSLHEETMLPMAVIERTLTPASIVFTNADFIAVALWMQPAKVLKEIGWSIDKMSMQQDPVDASGVQCRRIRIPRESLRWTSAIDVDPNRKWIPVRWQSWLDGKLSTVLTIDYRNEEEFGPVVNEWVYDRYNEEGEHESISRGRVTRCDLNGDIDDSRFTIKFPLGTHVVENSRGGNRYYIQMPSDLLVPINENDYGRTIPLDQVEK
jgi:hypothetical protein